MTSHTLLVLCKLVEFLEDNMTVPMKATVFDAQPLTQKFHL